MTLETIKKTDIWILYEQALDFGRQMGMFTDTDVNYRMYNGDQWAGVKLKGIEKIQYNFIKPIVKYKTGIVLSNLYAIHYSSENFENREFRKIADKVCELLNKRAAKIWEKDNMDMKFRKVVKEIKEEKVRVQEQAEFETMMDNIDSYDGTGLGQKDV